MEHPWASFFEYFFGQFLGRLCEPSQTASDQVWEPFGLHFGYILGAILDPISKQGEKVKIELPPKRKFNFQGPRHPQQPQKTTLLFRNPLREGSRGVSCRRFWCSWINFDLLWEGHPAPWRYCFGTHFLDIFFGHPFGSTLVQNMVFYGHFFDFLDPARPHFWPNS